MIKGGLKLKKLSRLVLGCIKATFCKKILVGKLSQKSTQCTPLHRSLISIVSLKIADNFADFVQIVAEFARILMIFRQIDEFSPKCSRNFAGLFAIFSSHVSIFISLSDSFQTDPQAGISRNPKSFQEINEFHFKN